MGDTEDANDEDVAWMARIAKGDDQAFRLLVEKHQGAVIGTVAKMTNCSADTEDIAQQVFLRIWKSAKRYQPTAKFTTFLFTVTRNLVFNETSKKSRRKESSIEEQEDDWRRSVAYSDETSQPDQKLAQSEMKEVVDIAIARLPEKQRLAVILRRYEQMPYEEMATVLELSVPAVKSQLFRARNSLREMLSDYLKD
ncbi:MAG: sigma-70 family RNA polymerase sigma factor [Akkermansiaceae bacterium]|nr:sigma-70 family RNA polymerase sigma factor [Akkermansiaceae bacterium]